MFWMVVDYFLECCGHWQGYCESRELEWYGAVMMSRVYAVAPAWWLLSELDGVVVDVVV